MKITKGTLIRTVVLLFALVNQILAICGVSPIPIDDDTATNVISTLWTAIASVVAWWKNNSFTQDAISADTYLTELKEQDIDEPQG